ncbi:uncharacterized protein LOC143925744 [Lithobates pipiens]
MALASSLFQCADPKKWQQVSDIYWEVVEAVGAKKKGLVDLDRCINGSYTIVWGIFLGGSQLTPLFFQRGKFRPRLQQMVASNPESTVESCTRKAFQHLPNVSAAIEELCQLKGIGPATASAVLCAGAPESAAFMADEAVESVPGLVPIQYNLKHYLKFLEEIRKKSETLNAESEEKNWTPHRVELCLWAWKVGQKMCPKLLETLEDADERPVKKLKTK